MSWHQEIVSQTVEDLVERNGPNLLAAHLRTACANYLRALDDMDSMRRSVRAEREAGERIIDELRRLHRNGRKTANIEQLFTIANRGNPNHG